MVKSRDRKYYDHKNLSGLLRFNATTKTCEQARHVICADPLVLESLFPVSNLVHGQPNTK